MVPKLGTFPPPVLEHNPLKSHEQSPDFLASEENLVGKMCLDPKLQNGCVSSSLDSMDSLHDKNGLLLIFLFIFP